MIQRFSRSAVCAYFLAVFLPSTASGATPTIDQLLSLKSVSRPRISPDGRFVSYEVTETDWKENAYVAHLWLADTQTGRSFQLTHGKKASDNAQWSPDGRWLAFLTDRESGAIAALSEKGEAKEEKTEEKTEATKDDKKDEKKIDKK